MALLRGGQPKPKTTLRTSQVANSKGVHRQTVPHSGHTEPHPTHAKHNAPHTASQTHPEVRASTKDAHVNLQGWPIPAHCADTRSCKFTTFPYQPQRLRQTHQ